MVRARVILSFVPNNTGKARIASELGATGNKPLRMLDVKGAVLVEEEEEEDGETNKSANGR